MPNSTLYRTLAILGIIIASVMILYYARGFFKPLAIAALLSMLLLPLVHKLISWGLPDMLAYVLGSILVLLLAAGLVYLVGLQVSRVVSDSDRLEQRFKKMTEQGRAYVSNTFGYSISDKQWQQRVDGLKKDVQGRVMGAIGTTTSILTDFLLVLVYIVVMLMARGRIKRFVLTQVPDGHRQRAKDTIHSIVQVTGSYLRGRLILIAILCGVYAAGFLIAGIQYAFFIAIIAAVLTIIPYIGNIIGGIIAVGMALLTGDSTQALIVLGVMTVAQFLESYVLQPLIVGEAVDLNPLFTISSVIAAGAVWGIAGMVVALPVFGSLKTLFDHIRSTEPVGYLLGTRDKVVSDYHQD